MSRVCVELYLNSYRREYLYKLHIIPGIKIVYKYIIDTCTHGKRRMNKFLCNGGKKWNVFFIRSSTRKTFTCKARSLMIHPLGSHENSASPRMMIAETIAIFLRGEASTLKANFSLYLFVISLFAEIYSSLEIYIG